MRALNAWRHLVLLAVLLLPPGRLCAGAGAPPDITVSAAISLKNVFDEIGRQFETVTGTHVILNYGASGDLMRQIAAGAPVDVFASASANEMDALQKQGLVDHATVTAFASTGIVLIVPAGSAAACTAFAALASQRVQKIAVGNPRTVPAGRYAQQVLEFFHLLPSVKNKLIYTENARQTLDYVARNEVDAGIVYAPDAAARARETTIVAAAPESSHSPVAYLIAAVTPARHGADARAFIAFVRSAAGRKILLRHGFTSIN